MKANIHSLLHMCILYACSIHPIQERLTCFYSAQNGAEFRFRFCLFSFFLVVLDMQASIACVLGLVTYQRNIHIWETVAPSPVTGWKFPSLHSRSWISTTGLKLIFFDISCLPPPRTFYKHIVAVKATIDKQSPHLI